MEEIITDILKNKCAWCGKQVEEDKEVYAVKAKALKGIDLEEHEGRFLTIAFEAAKKTIHAFVVTNDSPAKKEGIDLISMVCSRICAESVKATFDADQRLQPMQ